MFHSIITILTTAAVAFHAILGCCAHHTHSCDSNEPGLAVVASAEAKDDCSHGDHDHESGSPGEELAGDCGHKHDGGHHDDCDEGDCSFSTVLRSNDLELMLTFSMWCQALSDTAHADAFDNLLSLHTAAETSPDPLMDSGTARAVSQVWRL